MTDPNFHPFDVDRLNPEERALWDEHFAAGQDSLLIRVWGFGYWCMLAVDGVPAVVSEWLAKEDPDNLVARYLNNVRRAREGRRGPRRASWRGRPATPPAARGSVTYVWMIALIPAPPGSPASSSDTAVPTRARAWPLRSTLRAPRSS